MTEGLVTSAYGGVYFLNADKEVFGGEALGKFSDTFESKSLIKGIPENAVYLQVFIHRSGTAGNFYADDICLTLTDDYQPPLYPLTVNNGVGSGSYAEEDTVHITANDPEAHKFFDQWEGDVDLLNDPEAAQTFLVMPSEEVTVSAAYGNVQYRLDVLSGSGDGSYIFGEQVEIEAFQPSSGKQFIGWIGDNEYVADTTAATTTVTMPGQDIRIEATFDFVSSVDMIGQDVIIVPNPVIDGKVTIEQASSHQITEVLIFTLKGDLIRQIQLNRQTRAINVADLSKGVYLLRLRGVNSIDYSKKLIIK